MFKRGYINGKKRIKVTELGIKLVETLAKFCPDIVSEKMTRKLEEQIDQIRNGEKERKDVIKKAKGNLKKILEEFEGQKQEI